MANYSLNPAEHCMRDDGYTGIECKYCGHPEDAHYVDNHQPYEHPEYGWGTCDRYICETCGDDCKFKAPENQEEL